MAKLQMAEENGYDYYSNFIRNAIRDLKTSGICYAYYKEQVEEITKKLKYPIKVIQNDCGFTLSIPRKYREELFYE